ncbi:tRNA lysidine(34) synthetase TilS [Bosea sp. SSUT16]|uniref:tRNA(Ile)-lysidine synthase n=1 Tax=Bosea spartocytisi TaxID=2773451 RepID=A0A927ED57_9HYPH|nr:tRNA lysidine(34) synthetase TilS [Bosea spartocytisi]
MSAVPPLDPSATPVSAAEASALFEPLADEPGLLVAVSGGPDSVAVLALLADWAKLPGRPSLQAATVDHGLRPEAAGEAEAVARLCGRLGVAHRILRWAGPKPANGLQAAARQARYDLLAEEALRRGNAAIVTAHTLDDQAETLLMRIAHGSGPAGLVGMRPRSLRGAVAIVRPLLGLAKSRLIATAEARGLPFVRDPSNADSRFERVRWRELAPSLAEHGLDAARLGLLAERMARQEDALARRAADVLAQRRLPVTVGEERRLGFRQLAEEPEEIVLRVLALALAEMTQGVESYGRLERLEACAAALLAASRAGSATKRTFSGCILSLDRNGVLSLRREGPRRRGVHPATS